MKQLLELLPLVLFFGAYQMDGDTLTVGGWSHTFDGIFSATAVLMISTALIWLISSLLEKRNDKRLMWMTLAVLLFGAATLILRDQRFIQWKPTAVNWLLAAVFLGSQFIGKRTVIERVLGNQLSLPRPIWTRLNVLWIGNFALVGALNLFVAYRFEEAVWVSYKLYSSIGFTLAAVVLTVAIVAPHVKDDGEQPEGSQ